MGSQGRIQEFAKEGSQSLLPSSVSFPSGVRGRALAENEFGAL